MEPDLCFQVIEDARQLGVSKLAFSGGEPLLWPHIVSAVKFAAECDIETTVYSTGNAHRQREIITDLWTVGLKRMIFCLFASSELLHERITRKRESYKQTLSAIAICREVGIVPELHFVATARNYQQLPDICEIAATNGIAGISILRFVPQGRGKLLTNGTLSKTQSIELVAMIESLRNQGHTIRTGSPMNVFHINDNPSCFAAIDRMIIAPDSRVYPCDAFKQIQAEEVVGTDSGSVIGNVSLRECWIDSPYLSAVRGILDTEPVGNCRTCKRIGTCNTGCLAQKYLAYGKLERCPDPACIMN